MIATEQLIPEAVEILKHFKTYAEGHAISETVCMCSMDWHIPGDVAGRVGPMNTPCSKIEHETKGRQITVTAGT